MNSPAVYSWNSRAIQEDCVVKALSGMKETISEVARNPQSPLARARSLPCDAFVGESLLPIQGFYLPGNRLAARNCGCLHGSDHFFRLCLIEGNERSSLGKSTAPRIWLAQPIDEHLVN
jgi:hypothetical protein